MLKNCPRCKNEFDCKADTEENCACKEVDLDRATLAFLEKTHYKCLCNNCLVELNNKVLKVKDHPFNPKLASLKEGEYFYKENGLTVLTELYHIAKGQCCMSGCRHCAYGFNAMMRGELS